MIKTVISTASEPNSELKDIISNSLVRGNDTIEQWELRLKRKDIGLYNVYKDALKLKLLSWITEEIPIPGSYNVNAYRAGLTKEKDRKYETVKRLSYNKKAAVTTNNPEVTDLYLRCRYLWKNNNSKFSDWERSFVKNIGLLLSANKKLTAKQKSWIEKLLIKYKVPLNATASFKLKEVWNKYRLIKKYKEQSVALNKGLYEDKYLLDDKNDLLLKIYNSIDKYIQTPDKENKLKLSNLINASWSKIPRELKMRGKAYRIWLFSGVYAKKAIFDLKRKGSFIVKSFEFLSFTETNPVKDSVFKKYWTVFKSSVKPGETLVLIQKQEYSKGFSVTAYIKYLLDKGYLIDEDDLNDDLEYNFFELDTLTMVNKEQEIFVFDDMLEVNKADIVGIKVALDRNAPQEGLVSPIANSKFVTVKSLDEAANLLKLDTK